jgi:hypothetical protein
MRLPLAMGALLARDDFIFELLSRSNLSGSMIFSENRYPPRIESGARFFGTMLYPCTGVTGKLQVATNRLFAVQAALPARPN